MFPEQRQVIIENYSKTLVGKSLNTQLEHNENRQRAALLLKDSQVTPTQKETPSPLTLNINIYKE